MRKVDFDVDNGDDDTQFVMTVGSSLRNETVKVKLDVEGKDVEFLVDTGMVSEELAELGDTIMLPNVAKDIKGSAIESNKDLASEDKKSKKKAKPKADAKSKKDALEIFIPSEQISEDLSVSFPVDI